MHPLAHTIARLALLLVTAALCACSGGTGEPENRPLAIAATIPPLEWVARGLMPENASVSTLLPPGASEHGYEPPPSRVASFASADIVLMVGMGLEPAADRILRAQPRGGRAVVVFANASGAAARAAGLGHNHDHHAHDHDHEHDDETAEALDPHLWLDPPLMRTMVTETHDALVRILRRRGAPQEDIDALSPKRDALLARVDALHADFAAALQPFEGAAIVATHDAYRRFAARYGLVVAGSLHAHEGAEPSPGLIQRVADALRAAPIGLVFVEPQSPRAGAERLASMTGASVVQFDPLGSGDWEATMRANLDNLVRALEAARQRPSR